MLVLGQPKLLEGCHEVHIFHQTVVEVPVRWPRMIRQQHDPSIDEMVVTERADLMLEAWT